MVMKEKRKTRPQRMERRKGDLTVTVMEDKRGVSVVVACDLGLDHQTYSSGGKFRSRMIVVIILKLQWLCIGFTRKWICIY